MGAPAARSRRRRGGTGAGVEGDVVELGGEVEKFLDAFRKPVELVVTVGIGVVQPQLLAEVGEGVDGMGNVGGAVCADVLEHLPPGTETTLEDEVDPKQRE